MQNIAELKPRLLCGLEWGLDELEEKPDNLLVIERHNKRLNANIPDNTIAVGDRIIIMAVVRYLTQ